MGQCLVHILESLVLVLHHIHVCAISDSQGSLFGIGFLRMLASISYSKTFLPVKWKNWCIFLLPSHLSNRFCFTLLSNALPFLRRWWKFGDSSIRSILWPYALREKGVDVVGTWADDLRWSAHRSPNRRKGRQHVAAHMGLTLDIPFFDWFTAWRLIYKILINATANGAGIIRSSPKWSLTILSIRF